MADYVEATLDIGSVLVALVGASFAGKGDERALTRRKLFLYTRGSRSLDLFNVDKDGPYFGLLPRRVPDALVEQCFSIAVGRCLIRAEKLPSGAHFMSPGAGGIEVARQGYAVYVFGTPKGMLFLQAGTAERAEMAPSVLRISLPSVPMVPIRK